MTKKTKKARKIGIPETEYKTYIDIRYITFDLFKEYHTPEEVKTFNYWMRGQTGMVVPPNIMAIYAEDYERWLEEGKKTEQNAATWD